MQIVIDIPENIYEYYKNKYPKNCARLTFVENALLEGTPLPKGHGELKDVSKFHYVTMLSQNPKTGKHKHITVVRAQEINKAPTIIEADKEIEE